MITEPSAKHEHRGVNVKKSNVEPNGDAVNVKSAVSGVDSKPSFIVGD